MIRFQHPHLLSLYCLFISNHIYSNVLEKLDHHYYSVTIKPNQSINHAIKQASPIKINGHTFDASTNWTIRWQYDWEQEHSTGECKIVQVSVYLNTIITMPKLVGSHSQGQIRSFKQKNETLYTHEYLHYKKSRQTAYQLNNLLNNAPPASNCTRLEQQVNSMGHKMLQELTNWHQHYDKITQHGEKQYLWEKQNH
ncbi:DUF922 domain-containing protein [Neisseria sp. Ec49-e6-T10]|uniref:DUF922 domain-containing protein n=1 Tax=Neisseria sp. Ec49-e6-T10 TaxID=3140744 RepID=UPI003EBBC020